MLAVLLFDSVSLPVLEQLVTEGRLPALAELRRRGRWHTVAHAPAPLDTGHFTLYSGQPVDAHGLYYLYQWLASEQRLRYVHELSTPAGFWERCGPHTMVVDPYEGWVPHSRGGIFLRGFGFRERLVLPPHGEPSGEWRALTRRLGRPSRIDDVYGRPSLDQLHHLRRVLTAAPARVAGAAADVLGRRRCDLLFVGFGSAHLGGHHFWDLSQLTERDRRAARAGGLATALHDVYVAVDRAIGRIVEALPPGADVLVVSPTGMGPNTSRSDLLPGMLSRVLDPPAAGGVPPPEAGRMIWRVRGAIPTQWRARAVRPLPAAVIRRLAASMYLQGVDWKRTRAFVLPGDYRGFVRLNLRGRERDGVVEPRDADELLTQLAEGLATFCDPDGGPAVVAVRRTGAHLADDGGRRMLPDLVVEWSERSATELHGVVSPRYGDVLRQGVGTGRPGNHADSAWILAAPGASRLSEPSRPVGLVDVAATAVALLDGDRTALHGESLFEHR